MHFHIVALLCTSTPIIILHTHTHIHTHTHTHTHTRSFIQIAALLLRSNLVYVSENNGRVISIIANDCRLTMDTLYDMPSQFRKGIAVTPFGFGKMYMEVIEFKINKNHHILAINFERHLNPSSA